MSFASGGNGLDGLLESPGNLLEPPKLNGLGLLVVAHETVEFEGDLVGACGVDDRTVVGAGLDVGRRKDTDRVVGEVGLGKRALDGQSLLELDGGAGSVGGAGGPGDKGVGLELVADGENGSVHGGGEVAGHENRKGKLMLSLAQSSGMSKEVPGLKLRVLVLAVGAVALERSLLDRVHVQRGGETVNLDKVLLDIEEHLARDEGAGALLGVAVEDNGRALDAPVHCDSGMVVVSGGLAKGQGDAMVLLDGVCQVWHLYGMNMRVVVLFSVRGVRAGVARSRGRNLFDLGNVARRSAQEGGYSVGHRCGCPLQQVLIFAGSGGRVAECGGARSRRRRP